MKGISKSLILASLLGLVLAACSTGTNSRSGYQGSSTNTPNWTDGKNGSSPGSATTKGTTNGGD